MEVGSAASSYEILAKLAEGGMAEIFLARSRSAAGVERLVVIKRVLPQCAHDPDLIRMFIDEARLASQLQHPNIAQVYDVGKLGSSYFFSMEYVHGETVRDLLLHARGERIPLPLSTVLTIIAGAAAGLHHAHERRGLDGKRLSIVHRDVSPSNIMISREGVVKVVDFGIAKAEFYSSETERPLQGKLCYASPEQVRSQPVDRRADLFALGIVMWELLTLQGLFRGTSDFNVMQSIVDEPVPPPSQLRGDVPRELDDIVMRLLAKSPAARYQNGADLLEAIETAAGKLNLYMSPSSVARQMRTWFGDRAEPWIEQTAHGSTKRVVVDAEPVPGNIPQTIAGRFDDGIMQTIAGPVDQMLGTLAPVAARSDSHEGSPSWEPPTIENVETMRDRLFREAQARQVPSASVVVRDSVPSMRDSVPSMRSGTMLGVAAGGSRTAERPAERPVERPHVAPPMASNWRRTKARSPWPPIIAAILITLTTGGIGFGLLYSRMTKSEPPAKAAPGAVRDAGTADAPTTTP